MIKKNYIKLKEICKEDEYASYIRKWHYKKKECKCHTKKIKNKTN